MIELKPDKFNFEEVGNSMVSLWIRLREYLGSFSYRTPPGRNMKYILRQGDWLLGIIEFSSPVINLGVRDEYLEKQEDYQQLDCDKKGEKLRSVVGMTTCMPTQPFGYFYNGGKLLALLGASIKEDYKRKYSDILLYITTMSRNKPPTMYTRALRKLGYTKGMTYSHISNKEYARMMNWLKNNGYEIPSCKFGVGSNCRMRRIEYYIEKSGDKNVKKENFERPVYIQKSRSENERNEIIQGWWDRFGSKRIRKILNEEILEMENSDLILNGNYSNDNKKYQRKLF